MADKREVNLLQEHESFSVDFMGGLIHQGGKIQIQMIFFTHSPINLTCCLKWILDSSQESRS